MVSERRKQTGQQLLLRFEEGSDLRDRLEAIAKANGRSTTAEVLVRLKKSLEEDDAAAVPDFVGGRINELEKEVEALRREVRALATEVRSGRQ